ncbi:MAG: glycerol-3-phosphate dehydrogenase/oxidase, partial [Candidatus Obscuribacterales bacterium]|nr:glycerol-3-phosphate dehydrogenase/oxidase [Candidatus Obscuribacterales bacterium]
SFILPIGQRDKIFPLKARAGLALYDLLAGQLTGTKRHEKLSKKIVLDTVPALNPQIISGGLRFHDCITDDARLVIEVIKSACSMGALAINYLKATGFEMKDGLISAVKCHDRYSGKDISLATRTCVNAAGVWSDQVSTLVEPAWKNQVVPAKGIHIMVPGSSFETNSALFLPTRDKRYVFVVPWQRALMIGTTDTNFKGDIENALPEPEEIEYLLGVVNEYAGATVLKKQDVIAAWAGLRPLVGESDKAMIEKDDSDTSTSTISREHYMFEGPANMIGLIGGKLTNYRILAAHVVETIATKLPGDTRIGPSKTGTTMLGGWGSKEGYLTGSAEISARARRLALEPAILDHLTAGYGACAMEILDFIEQDPFLGKRICPDFPPVMAEVVFAIKQEMAVSLEDILFRRIRLGFVHQEQTREAIGKVARLVQSITGWDKQRTGVEVDSILRTLHEHMIFSDNKQKEEVL